MSLKPIDDRIVVEAIKAEPKTKGGIVLPDSAKETPQRGKVIAVGPGRTIDIDGKTAKLIPLTVEVGDIVAYPPFAGAKVEEGGREFLVMREADVLAIVE